VHGEVLRERAHEAQHRPAAQAGDRAGPGEEQEDGQRRAITYDQIGNLRRHRTIMGPTGRYRPAAGIKVPSGFGWAA